MDLSRRPTLDEENRQGLRGELSGRSARDEVNHDGPHGDLSGRSTPDEENHAGPHGTTVEHPAPVAEPPAAPQRPTINNDDFNIFSNYDFEEFQSFRIILQIQRNIFISDFLDFSRQFFQEDKLIIHGKRIDINFEEFSYTYLDLFDIGQA